MIPAFQRAKIVHALDHAATAIGTECILPSLISVHVSLICQLLYISLSKVKLYLCLIN
jgi:hypothetical protein